MDKLIIDAFKSQKTDYELSQEELENAKFWLDKAKFSSNPKIIKDAKERYKRALSDFDIDKKYFDLANSRVKSIFPPPVCEEIGVI